MNPYPKLLKTLLTRHHMLRRHQSLSNWWLSYLLINAQKAIGTSMAMIGYAKSQGRQIGQRAEDTFVT